MFVLCVVAYVLDEGREGGAACVCVYAKGGVELTCNISNSVIPSHTYGFNLSLIKSK